MENKDIEIIVEKPLLPKNDCLGAHYGITYIIGDNNSSVRITA